MKPTISPEIEAEFLRMPEAARFARVSRGTIYRWLADGGLASKVIRRPGNVQGIRLISKQALRDFINSCEDIPEDRPMRAAKKKVAKKGGQPA